MAVAQSGSDARRERPPNENPTRSGFWWGRCRRDALIRSRPAIRIRDDLALCLLIQPCLVRARPRCGRLAPRDGRVVELRVLLALRRRWPKASPLGLQAVWRLQAVRQLGSWRTVLSATFFLWPNPKRGLRQSWELSTVVVDPDGSAARKYLSSRTCQNWLRACDADCVRRLAVQIKTTERGIHRPCCGLCRIAAAKGPAWHTPGA
jgi:hypothetical protein